MRSDRYVHPEFGLLSPTPRLRRELRMAFFSLLFGIGIGAAAVIALSGNNPTAEHGVGSASVGEDRTESVLSYQSPQAAGIENESPRPRNLFCAATFVICWLGPKRPLRPTGALHPAALLYRRSHQKEMTL